jgi:hypothetical protein
MQRDEFIIWMAITDWYQCGSSDVYWERMVDHANFIKEELEVQSNGVVLSYLEFDLGEEWRTKEFTFSDFAKAFENYEHTI